MVNTAGGPSPPAVPTSFVTQNGTSVPLANIEIINGFDSSNNNVNGISTAGGVAGTGTQNEIDILLTNRLHNSVTTSNAVLTSLNTFTLTAPGTYMIQVFVVAFNSTDSLGATYQYNVSLRSTGAGVITIGPAVPIEKQEGTMVGVVVSFASVGAVFQVNVTGLAGKTIDWFGLLTYQYVG